MFVRGCQVSVLESTVCPYLARANELACLGLGLTGSNPIVGAVLVDSHGVIVGEGHHKGGAHAEVVAIESAGELARGTCLYLTLEPCTHQGKTGPCTEAIIAAGISKVVFAVSDPNPRASGGAQKLIEAGIETLQIPEASEISFANRAWLHKMKTGRPYFIWKVASTLDARTSAVDGSSKWITGAQSREEVSKMRAQSDAILIGTATAISDNPTLVPRSDISDRPTNPVRIVMGIRNIPDEFHLNDDKAETIYLRTHNFDDLVKLCQSRDFTQVLIESGGVLGTEMLKIGLIDELVIFQAPSLLGSGQSFIGDLDSHTISEKIDLKLQKVEQFGNDLKITLTRERQG